MHKMLHVLVLYLAFFHLFLQKEDLEECMLTKQFPADISCRNFFCHTYNDVPKPVAIAPKDGIHSIRVHALVISKLRPKKHLLRIPPGNRGTITLYSVWSL